MIDRENEIENYLLKRKKKENFTNALKGLFQIISYIIGIICCFFIFIYKIKNPHLTETEIMLYSFSKYWRVVLLVIVSAFINSN